MKKLLSLLKKVLPWVVAILIFAYLFTQYKPSQIWKAVEHANMLFFLGIGLIYFSILYFIDCHTISYTLTRFGYPVSFKELLPARAVTYLIMNISYPASQAAFAYYLKRTKNIPIFEVLSVFFFVAIIDLFIVITLAFFGSFFQDAVVGGVSISKYIQIVVLIAYACFIIQLGFWRGWVSKITGIKKEFKVITWIKSKKVFVVFKEATFFDYLRIALMRSPIHIAIVLFLYLAAMTFDAHIPIVNVVASVPIAFLIGTIPITPGGLGTTNVAIIELLSPHVTGSLIERGIVTAQELIFTVTILWMVFNYTLKSLVGVFWLRRVSTQLFKPTEASNPEEVVSEATHLMGDI